MPGVHKLERTVDVLVGLVAIAALGVASMRVVGWVRSRRPPTEIRGVVVDNWKSYADGGVRSGRNTAPVTVVEFADYKCPFCRMAEPDIEAVNRKYGRDVLFVYRDFPLHPHSVAPAVAARCANRFGRYQGYRALLYRDTSMVHHALLRYSVEVGISDTTTFKKCLRSSAVHDKVSSDSAAAVSLGVPGTPAILVDSVLFLGNPGRRRLEALIDTLMTMHRY